MAGEVPRGGVDLLRRLTVPLGLFVALVVAVAWYVTWATSDIVMVLMAVPVEPARAVDLALFFVLMVTMMVAMMLPSALPMIVAFHGITRLEGGRPVKAADWPSTGAFVFPYFLVWGGFGVLALLGLMALGLIGPLTGTLGLLPAATLVAAGVYQLTRTKEVCLAHCRSPLAFVLGHWRPGRLGAFRMGLRHSLYCIGCCWMFMLVLFVAGSMSLFWMGAVSVAIFAEKVSPTTTTLASRAIGAVLFVFGALLAAMSVVGS
ncbi:MAG TPA: DUF2182 domain-containing protein [Thermoplasmata archaeon]|nr:DUF2182 domain-containing protein [Thermoplasmata archaeon]